MVTAFRVADVGAATRAEAGAKPGLGLGLGLGLGPGLGLGLCLGVRACACKHEQKNGDIGRVPDKVDASVTGASVLRD